MSSLDETIEYVRSWCTHILDARRDVTILPLAGGANNAVFLCHSGSDRYVVKVLPPSSDGRADRFRAESEFLQYANTAAADFVPTIINIDSDARILAMEYLEGRRFDSENPPRSSDIECAAGFLCALNSTSQIDKPSYDLRAADGFLKLSAHLSDVRQRAADMELEHLPRKFRVEGGAFITALATEIMKAERALEFALCSSEIDDDWPSEKMILSPSDFGFHNAMATRRGVVFYDFEFAGWDDPAKTVCDFVLQPKVTPGQDANEQILCALAGIVNTDRVRARCSVLEHVLRIKWITIALAVLRPQRWQALIDVAFDKSPEMIIRERFATAHTLMNSGA